MQTTQFYMPFRGERIAPSYDKSKPRELVRFFRELERLFVLASVTSEEEKKEQTVRYVDFEVEEFWRTLPEFRNPLATYEEFKSAVLSLYPDASGDYKYAISDVDFLIRERQQVRINNATDLADFHLHFHMITSWLVARDHLDDLEQKRAYAAAFPPHLMTLITYQLQLKFPDLHPNLPYPIRDVYEAAQYFLRRSTSRPRNYFVPTPVSPATLPSAPATSISPIKSENLQSICRELSKTIGDALSQNGQRMECTSFNRNNRHPNSPPATGLRHATDMASPYATKLSLDDRITQIKAELCALRASESSFIPAAFNEVEEAKSAHLVDPDDEDEVPKTFPEKEIAPSGKAQLQEKKQSSNYDPVVPVSIFAPQLTIPDQVDPASEHLSRKAKHIAHTLPSARIIGASVPSIGKKLETEHKSQRYVYKAPLVADAYVPSQPTENAATDRPFLFISPNSFAQTQGVTAACDDLLRVAYSLQDPLQIDYNATTDFSTSLIIEAPTLPSSAPSSDLPATQPTSADFPNDQPCLNDLPPRPSSFATSFEFSDINSLRNTSETSTSDPHATFDTTCDHSVGISAPATATFLSTLGVTSRQGDFCADSDIYSIPSDYCDHITTRLERATTISTSTASYHCDFCDSDIKFMINLAISSKYTVNDHADKSCVSRENSNPFWNIPTLDPQLAPYVPTCRYTQDRKVKFKVFVVHSTYFLHILRVFFIFLSGHHIFQYKRSLTDSTFPNAFIHSQVGRFRQKLSSIRRTFGQQSDIRVSLRYPTSLRVLTDFTEESRRRTLPSVAFIKSRRL